MTTKLIAILFCLSFIGSSPATHAAEAKPLKKPEAAKIIEAIGYKDVAVAAIILGAVQFEGSPFCASSGAQIIAIGTKKGVVQRIVQSVYYDDDLGWFFFQYGEDQKDKHVTEIRIWTANGYKEVPPQAKAN